MKMTGVVFEGCSPEEVELAKKFWKSIDNLPEKKSTLSTDLLPDITQDSAGLRGVQMVQNSELDLTNIELQEFLDEAEHRKEEEEQENFMKYERSKNETQNRLNKRRQERIQKEAISKNALNEDLNRTGDEYDWDEKISSEREAREAMDEIDKFQKRLDQR